MVRWKYTIGQNIKNDVLDITILDREIRVRGINCKGKTIKENRKYYKYKCEICGYSEGWKEETKITNRGCPCCSGHIAVNGINSVGDKRPDLLKYFVNKQDAFEHTVGSKFIAELKCPICKSINTMDIYTFTRQGFSCSKCGDYISYPEKFIMSFLEQAKVTYIYQLSKKIFQWCDKYKYDFYVQNENCIIEVNGSQHYDKCFTNKNAMTLEEVQINDSIKEKIALKNGINNYITIDCRKSDLKTIKQGIINSNICNILKIDINHIDFNKCALDANRNIMKEVCDFYNEHKDMTPPNIAPYFRIDRVTVLEYLKRGAEIGICHYDVEQAKRDSKIKGAQAASKKLSKKIYAYDNNKILIGEFMNASQTVEYFKNNFDVHLNSSTIQAVCTGKYKQHKGYIFKYVS